MYDIIGDIHGYAEELKQLLEKMGYQRKNGLYFHPKGRKALFVGDFIDRGPQVRETLLLAKGMCDAGYANAVMGNHEYNAVCFHTPDPQNGGYFREHSEKNIAQHQSTLQDFKDHPQEWDHFLEWFKTLPLYLDFGELRAVHACWDNQHIKWLEKHYRRLSPEFLQQAAGENKDYRIYKIIEETLKGKEYPLPEGMTFKDKGGKVRHQCRIRWWKPPHQRKTYGDVLIECPDELSEKELESETSFYSYTDGAPVFFGHYWLQGEPRTVHSKAICLDYSVAQEGKLVAYRWFGPNNTDNHFIY